MWRGVRRTLSARCSIALINRGACPARFRGPCASERFRAVAPVLVRLSAATDRIHDHQRKYGNQLAPEDILEGL